MLLVLMFLNPYEFASVDNDLLLIMVFLTSFALPVFAIFLMKQLNMVSSFELNKREDRIGPFIITAILYLSLFLHLKKAGSFPEFMVTSTLAVLISLFAAFFANNFVKVSLHAVGMGGFLAFIVFAVKTFAYSSVVRGHIPILGTIEINPVLILYLGLLIAGAVCTSRLLLNAHKPSDVYGGLIIGFVSISFTYLFLI